MSPHVEPRWKTPAEPKTRKRLRPVSKRRQEENRVRRANLVSRYGTNPPCYACPILRRMGIETGCFGRASDGHEVLTRGRGGSITDPDNVLPVSRICHSWITTHPVEAEEFGLVRSGTRGTVTP